MCSKLLTNYVLVQNFIKLSAAVCKLLIGTNFLLSPWFLLSVEVRENQGRNIGSEKVREIFVPKSRKDLRVGEIRGKSKYQGAKVNKDAEKN